MTDCLIVGMNSLEFPFYLDATRRLAQSAAGMSQAVDKRLIEHAVTAERQGMGVAGPVYRISAIGAALARGDTGAAEEYLSSVSSLETDVEDATTRRNAVRALTAHAMVDLARRDARAASEHISQAAALIPESRRAADPEWRGLLLARAQAEYALAQYSAAAADAESAVARARQDAVDPQSSAWVGEALVWRARTELGQGKRVAAQESAREAMPHLQQNLDPSHPLIAAARQLASR